MHVVLVADNERALRRMQDRFMVAGHEVAAFAAFEPAKRYLAANRPDVLVTDIRLGAFNGLQLVMLAKRGRPDTVAYVLSPSDDNVLRRDAATIGACFHLKPVESEQLLSEINGTARRTLGPRRMTIV